MCRAAPRCPLPPRRTHIGLDHSLVQRDRAMLAAGEGRKQVRLAGPRVGDRPRSRLVLPAVGLIFRPDRSIWSAASQSVCDQSVTNDPRRLTPRRRNMPLTCDDTEPTPGLEPGTTCLQDRCAANCATPATRASGPAPRVRSYGPRAVRQPRTAADRAAGPEGCPPASTATAHSSRGRADPRTAWRSTPRYDPIPAATPGFRRAWPGSADLCGCCAGSRGSCRRV